MEKPHRCGRRRENKNSDGKYETSQTDVRAKFNLRNEEKSRPFRVWKERKWQRETKIPYVNSCHRFHVRPHLPWRVASSYLSLGLPKRSWCLLLYCLGQAFVNGTILEINAAIRLPSFSNTQLTVRQRHTTVALIPLHCHFFCLDVSFLKSWSLSKTFPPWPLSGFPGFGSTILIFSLFFCVVTFKLFVSIFHNTWIHVSRFKIIFFYLYQPVVNLLRLTRYIRFTSVKPFSPSFPLHHIQ